MRQQLTMLRDSLPSTMQWIGNSMQLVRHLSLATQASSLAIGVTIRAEWLPPMASTSLANLSMPTSATLRGMPMSRLSIILRTSPNREQGSLVTAFILEPSHHMQCPGINLSQPPHGSKRTQKPRKASLSLTRMLHRLIPRIQLPSRQCGKGVKCDAAEKKPLVTECVPGAEMAVCLPTSWGLGTTLNASHDHALHQREW